MNTDAVHAAGSEPSVARWRRLLRVALGLGVGGAAVWIVVSAAGGFADALHALERTTPWWLVPAVVCEALAYVVSGLRLRRLAGSGADLSPSAAVGVELVTDGLGLLTPASPAEGLAFAATELHRRGLPRRRVGITLGFTQWFSTRVFYLVSALNLLLILATRDLPVDTTWPIVAASLVLFLLLATAVLANRPSTAEHLAIALGALRFWKPRPSREERRAAGARFYADAKTVVGPPRKRAVLMAMSVLSLLCDVTCLWLVLIATGARVDFDVAVLAVGAGAVAASIPLLPGGLGVVEAVIPAVVHWYGAPVGAALAAVLLYRAVGTFLPAAAGAVSILALRAHRTSGQEHPQ